MSGELCCVPARGLMNLDLDEICVALNEPPKGVDEFSKALLVFDVVPNVLLWRKKHLPSV